jgi:hypothetical protein
LAAAKTVWIDCPNKGSLADIMKLILLSCCLAVLLFQSGCAMAPPTDQQGQQQKERAEQAQRSAVFANGLQQ